MWRILRGWRQKLLVRRHRTRVERALSLHCRGGLRNDGLPLIESNYRLYVQWQARDVHPWDSDLASEEKSRTFLEQCMEDTERAIFRLFSALPEVEVIDISVRKPASDSVVFAGTVLRADLDDVRSVPSIRMRLRRLGIAHHLPVAG